MNFRTIFRAALCAMAVSVALLCGASAHAALTPEAAAAYQGVINDLAGEYGSARTAPSGSPVEGMYIGLTCACLVDFDGDGTPELYCAYGIPNENRVCQVLYAYNNGLIRLDIPEAVSNFGTDVSPSTRLFTSVGKAYLVDGQEVMNGNEVRYLTKQGDRMASAFTYVNGLQNGQQVRRVNNQTMTPDGLTRALNTFTLNMRMTEYSYWSNGDGEDPTATIQPTLRELRALTVTQAAPATAHVSIGGKRYDIAAYTIRGNNYLKLRDFAAAMSGTATQFAVDWDVETRKIRIATGQRYVRTGGELDGSPTEEAEAERSAAALLLDGKALSPTAYIIEQNHYYRLRDLAEALDLAVDWEPHSKTATLTPR